MRKVDVLIIGAGPCGLGAVREMLRNGRGSKLDFLLVDPAQDPGGWARSETTPEGFTFDFGGHVLFPHKHYQEFADLLQALSLPWHSSVPSRGLHTTGCFLPYPAQRNIQRLPLPRLLQAIGSILLNRVLRAGEALAPNLLPLRAQPSGDLRSYLRRSFGSYLTDTLLGPLNRKQWAHAPETLSDVWTQHRSGSAVRNVPDVELTKILRNLLTDTDDLGWTPETLVSYPASGGSGAIWKATASGIPAENMLMGTRVASLSLAQRTAKLSNGETVQWKHVISTMPLDTLLRSIAGRLDLTEKAQRFVRARSRLFGFGIQGLLAEQYQGLHSCQVPDADVPFWRLNFPMTVSSGNGPAGCYSLLCEVSEPASEEGLPLAELREKVEQSLRTMGLLGSPGQAVTSRWEQTVEHGYPVPFLGRDALLAEVLPMLERSEVYSRGRFGSWRYEISNQDHAYMQGIEVVRRILFGVPEETFGNALVVNGSPSIDAPVEEEECVGALVQQTAVANAG